MVRYEWDEAKRISNLKKHRLDFSIAWRVFADPFAVEEEERSMSHGELRYKVTGVIDELLVTVIFTERSGAIRVISVRRATASERKIYEEG